LSDKPQLLKSWPVQLMLWLPKFDPGDGDMFGWILKLSGLRALVRLHQRVVTLNTRARQAAERAEKVVKEYEDLGDLYRQ